jgi:FkbM family methyltransferase
MKPVKTIMDVGMHHGLDTQFYLDKGFRVVAIEAHPEIVALNRQKFREYMEAGRLQLVPYAIAETEGTMPFYVFPEMDDWGTLDADFVSRNIGRGSRHQRVDVLTTTFESVLRRYGVPYYIKIDIEGSDILCLRALHSFAERPKYLSIEMPLLSYGKSFEILSHLYILGYRKYKIVNQGLNSKQRCPNPPREGTYAETGFSELMSGPFGEETPGPWLGIEQTVTRYRRLLQAQALFSAEGSFPSLVRLYNVGSRLLGGGPLSWYDVHAALPASDADVSQGGAADG